MVGGHAIDQTQAWARHCSCTREQCEMRNITMSADDQLIDRARKKAARENTTLNERLRRWLEQYVGQRSAVTN